MSQVKISLQHCEKFYFGLVRYKLNSDVDQVRSRIAFVAHGENSSVEEQIEKLRVSLGSSEISDPRLIPVAESEFKVFYSDMINNGVGFCAAIESEENQN